MGSKRITGQTSHRRDFLRASGLGTLSLGIPASILGSTSERRSNERAVILLMMVGGPSQLETFDPKPDAPTEIRGPFRSIETAVPGVRVVEHLGEVARRMRRLTLIRSLHHDSAPIHETGLQMVGTGKLCRANDNHPHLGSIAAQRLGSSGGLPPFVILPQPIGNTGVSIPNGQSAASLAASFEPFVLGADPAARDFDPRRAFDQARGFLDESTGLTSSGAPDRSSRHAFDLSTESASTRSGYGHSTFGQSCLLARKLVESGVKVVVVNMAETVFDRPSWDAHGSKPFSRFHDYATNLLPSFDRAFSALVDDLESRGLLESTLVVATGEFGRSPRINASGGRDHWPGAWSALMAGGGMTGGQVIGATDRNGAEPVDRPVLASELFAMMASHLGLD
jgi:uncharacterized protein (DUF1501 family)